MGEEEKRKEAAGELWRKVSKSRGRERDRARREEEKKKKKKKKRVETYPVEIPRFVRRQFEFYYRREGLRSPRDVVAVGRSETRKTREERPREKDERTRGEKAWKFQDRNCKLLLKGRG